MRCMSSHAIALHESCICSTSLTHHVGDSLHYCSHRRVFSNTVAQTLDTLQGSAAATASPNAASPFSSPNPLFPVPSPTARLRSPRAGAGAGAALPADAESWRPKPVATRPAAATSTAPAPHLSGFADDSDDSSVDSITLDDGPNPLKQASPGRAPRSFAQGLLHSTASASGPLADRIAPRDSVSTMDPTSEGPQADVAQRANSEEEAPRDSSSGTEVRRTVHRSNMGVG